MMAKPIKTLELRYPMIYFSIKKKYSFSGFSFVIAEETFMTAMILKNIKSFITKIKMFILLTSILDFFVGQS